MTDADILADVLKRVIRQYAQLDPQRDGYVLLVDGETAIGGEEIAAVRRAFDEAGRDYDR